MRISTLEDHCLRCLSQIAAAGGRVTIGRIAGGEGLSVENTAKVLARLREAKLIESFRGKDGGYVLSRPAEEISVSDVLVAVGGDLFEYERCHGVNDGEPCIHEHDCGIRPIWVVLEEMMHAFLSSITLADLVDDEGSVRARLDALRAKLPQPVLPRIAGAALASPRPVTLRGADPAKGGARGAADRTTT